ncbi:MAG TPA: hypothetical protein VF930_12535 [Stellaceae bacterium]
MAASTDRDRPYAWARPGTAFMHPKLSGERVLAFSSHYLWPALVALPVLPSFYAAVHGKRLPFGSIEWFAVIGVGGVFLAVSLLLFLFRESLVLDLEGWIYTHRRGYWPHLTTQQGSLNEFQAVALDVPPARRKGGTIWVASLQFMAPNKRIAVANFSGGSKAYAYVDELARKLQLPVLDRTGEDERTTRLSQIDTPIVARTGLAPRRIDAPPIPRIRLSGDAPHRLITLPAPGVNLGVVFIAALPALLIWLGATALTEGDAPAAARAAHRHLRQQIPHATLSPWLWTTALFTLAALCVAFLVLLCAARWQIREHGDSIVVTSRALGIRLRRRRFRKDEIVAIELKPTPAGRAMLYDLQIRARRKLLLIGTTLGEDSAKWLEQALLSMLAAR